MTGSARAPAWPTAATRPLAVLGWPVAHSLSPVIHNAALAADGLDLVYLALPTPPERLTEVVGALGAMEAVGANVTVPHKVAVLDACDRLSEEARLIGAVNTLTWTPDGLEGHNTDAIGLRDALVGTGLSGGEAGVLLGTGGAARAAAVAAGRLGLSLTVVGRRPAAAEEVAALAERAGARAVAARHVDDESGLADDVAQARLVVNATPLGMQGERLARPLHHLEATQIAYDLIYAPAQTPFLASAAARGARSSNGLGMLVGQAAASYERWTGRRPDRQVMTSAAESALAGEPEAGSPEQ